MYSRNEDNVTSILARIQHDIEEIKNMMKLYLLQSGREVSVELNKVLSTPQKKIAYELTDGYHTAHAIAGIVKVSTTSINRWWREWQRLGIATRVKIKGRSTVRKIFSLNEMGIEVPDVSSLRGDEYEVGDIPTEERLESILSDSGMFRDKMDLQIFAEKVFSRNFAGRNKKDLIVEIIRTFYRSSKRTQMMFIQALRQQANRKGSRFKEYFESWEEHIRREI